MIWNVLRECCEAEDSETAELILEGGMMACVDGNIRQTFFISHPGHVYRVPNFCICDPHYERKYEEVKKKCSNLIENKIIVVLYYFMDKNKNIKIETSNKTLIKDLKSEFANKVDIDLEKVSLRFFYKGQELLDDNLLCYNSVDNNGKIQVMIYNK